MSTAISQSAEVFRLLDQLKATGELETVKIEEPDRYLISPREPDFVDGYQFETITGHPITLRHIWEAYVAGEQILLSGPSGCGKSTIAFHMLDKANEKILTWNNDQYKRNINALKAGAKAEGYKILPYELTHYSCHQATRSEELIGTVTVKVNKDGSREPLVIHGAVTDAWVNGKTLVLEEMDFAPAGVWGECHQFFDGRTLETSVYINGPERIKKHSRFRLIATANTLGQGENQIEFAGTQVLNSAFLDRFTYVVRVGWLPDNREIDLITKKSKEDHASGLRLDITRKMVGSAKQIRESHMAGTCEKDLSTRTLISWARECLREEERYGATDCKKMDVATYWREVAVPSAGPTFLNKITEPNTVEIFKRFLDIR